MLDLRDRTTGNAAVMANVVVDVLLDPRLHVGITVGAVVFASGLAASFIRPTELPGQYGGLMLAAGVTVGLIATDLTPFSVVPGIAALAVAGALRTGILVRALFAVPGAWITIAATAGETMSWMPWFAIAAIITTGPLAASFDGQNLRTALALPMFAVASFGVYLTVPDTEQALILIGAASVAGLLGWPKARLALGPGGAFALAGLYSSIALQGSVGRPAAVIAAVACLGLVITAPVASWALSRGANNPLEGFDPTWILIGQLALVLVISRTFGRASAVWLVALGSAVALGATTWILIAVDRRSRGA